MSNPLVNIEAVKSEEEVVEILKTDPLVMQAPYHPG